MTRITLGQGFQSGFWETKAWICAWRTVVIISGEFEGVLTVKIAGYAAETFGDSGGDRVLRKRLREFEGVLTIKIAGSAAETFGDSGDDRVLRKRLREFEGVLTIKITGSAADTFGDRGGARVLRKRLS
ncbi:hypothetical protein COLO4_32942 [Corchorus olitorius]|uniref:Uncharacterized protein n=1 Tax=Corchorus olitorius TaxID=93759 RepID=A0A1R3GXE4_9ROSI|nr:hypothetical protein COLO4_32942 [Corchorus olitorius]